MISSSIIDVLSICNSQTDVLRFLALLFRICKWNVLHFKNILILFVFLFITLSAYLWTNDALCQLVYMTITGICRIQQQKSNWFESTYVLQPAGWLDRCFCQLHCWKYTDTVLRYWCWYFSVLWYPASGLRNTDRATDWLNWQEYIIQHNVKQTYDTR